MTINNAKLKACIKLSSKVTVYVPATNGVSEAADNTEQVKKTAALLADLFGGSTSTAALGYWLSPVAGLVAPGLRRLPRQPAGHRRPGKISIYRVGQIMPAQELRITI